MNKGQLLAHCRTCGSDIVETVNDSVFRGGECDGCEYTRYRSQPALLQALERALPFIEQEITDAYAVGEEAWAHEIETVLHEARDAIAKAA